MLEDGGVAPRSTELVARPFGRVGIDQVAHLCRNAERAVRGGLPGATTAAARTRFAAIGADGSRICDPLPGRRSLSAHSERRKSTMAC